MAEGDSAEWEFKQEGVNEEPADMAELDYDYSTVDEKIAAGLVEKEKGNKLFAQREYEAAWKKYDRCFVLMYTSKEEWEAIGSEAHKKINNFKLPCHLNRGLCRLRKEDFGNALWDFTEALRIDPVNPKGLYRRAVVLIGIVKKDMAKQGTDELWDLDISENRAEDAKKDLLKAIKLVPNDRGVRKAFEDVKAVKEQLAVHRKRYSQDQKKLYSKLILNLDKDNQKLREAEEEGLFENMPRLERIRIA